MRWPELFSEANNAARTLFLEWIAKFGSSFQIITDQGLQFDSQLFRKPSNLEGTKNVRTPAFHVMGRWSNSIDIDNQKQQLGGAE